MLSVVASEEAKAVQAAVREDDVEVAWCNIESMGDAIELAVATRFDAILLDTSGSLEDAVTALDRIRAERGDLPIMALRSDDDRGADLLVRAGADDVLDLSELGAGALARAVRYAAERHRLQSEIEALGVIDPVTGLRNRRGFLAIGHQELKVAARHRLDVAVLLVSLADLAARYRSRGRRAGDQALREFASALRRATRSSDLTGRVAHDELAVLMLQAGSSGTELVRRRLSNELARMAHSVEAWTPLRWFAGSASQEWSSNDLLENLVERASRVMYRARAGASGHRPAAKGDLT